MQKWTFFCKNKSRSDPKGSLQIYQNHSALTQTKTNLLLQEGITNLSLSHPCQFSLGLIINENSDLSLSLSLCIIVLVMRACIAALTKADYESVKLDFCPQYISFSLKLACVPTNKITHFIPISLFL